MKSCTVYAARHVLRFQDRDSCLAFKDKALVLSDRDPDEEHTLHLRLFVDMLQAFIDGYPYKGGYKIPTI